MRLQMPSNRVKGRGVKNILKNLQNNGFKKNRLDLVAKS